VRLAAFAITVDQVIAAVERSNENISAGFYVEGGQEFLIHGRAGCASRRTSATRSWWPMRGGEPVLVRDVAEVRIGAGPTRGTGGVQRRPAVVIGIQKQPAPTPWR
jgi:Cu/Ag efflux pump CusA